MSTKIKTRVLLCREEGQSGVAVDQLVAGIYWCKQDGACDLARIDAKLQHICF